MAVPPHSFVWYLLMLQLLVLCFVIVATITMGSPVAIPQCTPTQQALCASAAFSTNALQCLRTTVTGNGICEDTSELCRRSKWEEVARCTHDDGKRCAFFATLQECTELATRLRCVDALLVDTLPFESLCNISNVDFVPLAMRKSESEPLNTLMICSRGCDVTQGSTNNIERIIFGAALRGIREVNWEAAMHWYSLGSVELAPGSPEEAAALTVLADFMSARAIRHVVCADGIPIVPQRLVAAFPDVNFTLIHGKRGRLFSAQNVFFFQGRLDLLGYVAGAAMAAQSTTAVIAFLRDVEESPISFLEDSVAMGVILGAKAVSLATRVVFVPFRNESFIKASLVEGADVVSSFFVEPLFAASNHMYGIGLFSDVLMDAATFNSANTSQSRRLIGSALLDFFSTITAQMIEAAGGRFVSGIFAGDGDVLPGLVDYAHCVYSCSALKPHVTPIIATALLRVQRENFNAFLDEDTGERTKPALDGERFPANAFIRHDSVVSPRHFTLENPIAVAVERVDEAQMRQEIYLFDMANVALGAARLLVYDVFFDHMVHVRLTEMGELAVPGKDAPSLRAECAATVTRRGSYVMMGAPLQPTQSTDASDPANTSVPLLGDVWFAPTPLFPHDQSRRWEVVPVVACMAGTTTTTPGPSRSPHLLPISRGRLLLFGGVDVAGALLREVFYFYEEERCWQQQPVRLANLLHPIVAAVVLPSTHRRGFGGEVVGAEWAAALEGPRVHLLCVDTGVVLAPRYVAELERFSPHGGWSEPSTLCTVAVVVGGAEKLIVAGVVGTALVEVHVPLRAETEGSRGEGVRINGSGVVVVEHPGSTMTKMRCAAFLRRAKQGFGETRVPQASDNVTSVIVGFALVPVELQQQDEVLLANEELGAAARASTTTSDIYFYGAVSQVCGEGSRNEGNDLARLSCVPCAPGAVSVGGVCRFCSDPGISDPRCGTDADYTVLIIGIVVGAVILALSVPGYRSIRSYQYRLSITNSDSLAIGIFRQIVRVDFKSGPPLLLGKQKWRTRTQDALLTVYDVMRCYSHFAPMWARTANRREIMNLRGATASETPRNASSRSLTPDQSRLSRHCSGMAYHDDLTDSVGLHGDELQRAMASVGETQDADDSKAGVRSTRRQRHEKKHGVARTEVGAVWAAPVRLGVMITTDIAILYLRVDDFERALTEGATAPFSHELLGELYAAVHLACEYNLGLVEGWVGDKCVCTFNGLRFNNKPESSAVRVAMSVHAGAPGFLIRAGVASGSARVGVMGRVAGRWSQVIGPVVSGAFHVLNATGSPLMARHCPVAINYSMARKLPKFCVRIVGSYALSAPFAVASIVGKCKELSDALRVSVNARNSILSHVFWGRLRDARRELEALGCRLGAEDAKAVEEAVAAGFLPSIETGRSW